MKQTIALIGNPNSGKTTLFNSFTGSNQRTGNWPGVTVERKEGKYSYDGKNVTAVDLPGVYALDAEDEGTGLDELVARDYLLSGEADLVVNIVDASNLERNLYLTTQVVEMRLPTIVALNMMDVAKKNEVEIDIELLSERLGCQIVPISASREEGIPELKRAINECLAEPKIPPTYVAYPAAVEDALAELVPLVRERQQNKTVEPRWTALKLLEYEDEVAPELQGRELNEIVVKNRRKIHQQLEEDIDIIIADSRYSFIHSLTLGAVKHSTEISTQASDKIDRILLNRWAGIPIFFGVMYLMFLISINVGGAFIDFFDIGIGTVFVDAPAHFLEKINTPGWLIGLIASAGGGIQTTATFIPQIGLMFVILAILEDSGYMARAAFVMDRLMRFVGLPGKSFVPMLVGFGCNVPAIMAARTLENKHDRTLTIMMNPFMSCSARLPVYALFAAAFFPRGGQNMVFGLYLLGISAAIFTGLVMKNTLLQGEAAPFVMELPPYHLPNAKGVLLRAWDRLKAFIKKAGKMIVVMVIVLGLLNSVGTDGSFGRENTQNSLLSATSRAITPAFAPMGITQENWPATVGIFTGVFAKEVMVGSLDAIYGELAEEEAAAAGEVPEEEEFSFWSGIGEAFASIPANLADLTNQVLDPIGLNIGEVGDIETAAAEQEVTLGTFGQMVRRFDGYAGAFAYLLFVLLYFPCVSATAAVYRETNLGWTVFVGAWTTGLGYWVASLFYQAATFSRHPVSSFVWIVGSALVIAGVILGLRLKAIAPGIKRPWAN